MAVKCTEVEYDYASGSMTELFMNCNEYTINETVSKKLLAPVSGKLLTIGSGRVTGS